MWVCHATRVSIWRRNLEDLALSRKDQTATTKSAFVSATSVRLWLNDQGNHDTTTETHHTVMLQKPTITFYVRIRWGRMTKGTLKVFGE